MPDAHDRFNEATELAEQGQLDEAFDKVLKLSPHDTEAQSQRGLITRKMAHVSDTQKMGSHSAQSQLRV